MLNVLSVAGVLATQRVAKCRLVMGYCGGEWGAGGGS